MWPRLSLNLKKIVFICVFGGGGREYVKSKGKLWESVLFCRIGPGDKSEAIRLGSKCLYWLSYLASPGLKLLILLKAEIYIGPGHCFIHSESTMPATELVLSLIG